MIKTKSLSNFFKKNGPISPINQSQSTKIFKRKPNINVNESRTINKNHSKQISSGNIICYISPKKFADSLINVQSQQSIPYKVSNKSINIHQKNHLPQKNSTAINKSSAQLNSYKDIYRQAKTSIQENMFHKQIKLLREKQKKNHRKLEQYSKRLEMLKEENNYLYQQIETLQQKNTQSSQQICQLTVITKSQSSQIQQISQKLQIQQNQNIKLIQLVQNIQKSKISEPTHDSFMTDSSSFFSPSSQPSDIIKQQYRQSQNSQKFQQKNKLKQELQLAQQQLYKLHERMKYSEIQSAMLIKIREQNNTLYSEQIKLRLMNKKLLKRVQFLTQKLQVQQKKINNSIRNQPNYGRRRMTQQHSYHDIKYQRQKFDIPRQSLLNRIQQKQILFQLSPEK